MKKIVALVLCMVLALGVLAGCGASNKFVGEWKISEFFLEKFENQELREMLSKTRLCINRDGTFSIISSVNEAEGLNGTYTTKVGEMVVWLTYDDGDDLGGYKLFESDGELFLVSLDKLEEAEDNEYIISEYADYIKV